MWRKSKHLSTQAFVLSMIGILIVGSSLIAALYFYVNPKSANISKNPFERPVTSEPVSLSLNISSPDDNLLVFDTDLLIQGTTIPNAIVILDINNNNMSLETNLTGSFSTTAKLKSGVNELNVTVFDNQGNSKTDSRTIYYSTEKL